MIKTKNVKQEILNLPVWVRELMLSEIRNNFGHNFKSPDRFDKTWNHFVKLTSILQSISTRDLCEKEKIPTGTPYKDIIEILVKRSLP